MKKNNTLTVDADKIETLISVLQSMLSPSEDTTDSVVKEKPKKNRKRTTNNIQTKTPINKFDSMSEKHMHKNDVLIDKKLNRLPPVPRTRSFAMIDVRCRVCGKEEEISPALLVESKDRYKCNRCSSSAG